METLGQRIKIVRGENKQEYFAAKLNVDRTTLSSWEIDRREPYLQELIKIARLGGVSVEWLVTGQEIAATKEIDNDAPKWQEVVDFAISRQFTPAEVMQILKTALNEKNALMLKELEEKLKEQ
jgi:transcriptional regulator with XRE-family HTH domain